VIAWLVGRLESGKMVVERASSCTSSRSRILCKYIFESIDEIGLFDGQVEETG
jgi:hypothetical protein